MICSKLRARDEHRWLPRRCRFRRAPLLLNVRNTLLVAGHGFGVGFVARGQDHHGQFSVDQRIGTVFIFAGGIAFVMM